MSPRKLPANPNQVRMTFGEHLEELRWRLVRAILGVLIGMAVAFLFRGRIMMFLVEPFVIAARQQGAPERMLALQPPEVFLVVLKMCFIVGLMIASPYALYQIWAFVAAGLYPAERRSVTRLVPASVGLFAAGVAFLFYIVLPLVLRFLLSLNAWVPMPSGEPNPILRLILSEPGRPESTASHPAVSLPRIPVLDADPADPEPFSMWVNRGESRLKVFLGDGQWMVADLRPATGLAMVESRFSLRYYISFVTSLAFGFGLGFQVPLVVLFISRVGIATPEQMARARRVIIFSAFVAAAFLTPPDVTSQILLAVPMILLFEIGLLAAKMSERRREANEQA